MKMLVLVLVAQSLVVQPDPRNCTAWIFGGGVRDAYRLFRDLKTETIDDADDGTVKSKETTH